MKKCVFTKVTSVVAIVLIAVCGVWAIQACKEKDKVENKTIIFYSDFYSVNCPVDSISIYIDNNYVGKLLKSYIPGSTQVGTRDSENTLETKVSKGKHTYLAKINGGCNVYWSGEFDAIVDLEINLKMSESKKTENEAMKLNGTTWKLISIVDMVSNKSRAPEPNKDDNFMIKFQDKDLINGYLAINTINGRYYVDYSRHTIEMSVTSSTFADDSPDGYAFLQYIKNVNKFVVTNDILKLFYNDIVCLELERR
jgi:hypothetical protein